jgi:Asp-tRNA(Asn)/Glu-tRNA(Gln) amidotransferase A subunit family amidase
MPVGAINIMLDAESAAAFDEVTRNGQDDMMVRQIKNAWPNAFRASRFIPAVEYLQASRVRQLLIQQMQQVMSTVDVYLGPSQEGSSLLLTNLTGHPCVVLPSGFDANRGIRSASRSPGNFSAKGRSLRSQRSIRMLRHYHRVHPTLDK